jgi:hypothetical protein
MCERVLKKNILVFPPESFDLEDRQVVYFQLSNIKKPKIEKLKIAFSYVGRILCEK